MRSPAGKRTSATRLRHQDLDLGLPSGRPAQAASHVRAQAITATLRSIPRGKVATYGQVAAAAGYPRHHRAVASLLRTMAPDEFPWHRIVGAGGAIKAPGIAAAEQRLRLRLEGVTFAGKRVNLRRYQHDFALD